MQSGTMMEDTALRSFCAQQREWLELELQSEQDVVSPLSKEERSSHVLHQLQASDVSVGLYGRTVVRLISNQTESVAANSSSNESLLPAHKFTTGDEVEIRAKSSGSSKMNHPSGVVSQVTESSLSVALFPSQNHRHNENSRDVENDDNDDDIFGNPPLSVIPRSNVQVHRKLLAALEELETKGFDHPVSGRVVQALFDPSPSSELSFHNRPPDASTTGTQPFNTNLDASQVEAISFALTSNQPIALIHGPVRCVVVVVVPVFLSCSYRICGNLKRVQRVNSLSYSITDFDLPLLFFVPSRSRTCGSRWILDEMETVPQSHHNSLALERPPPLWS